MPVAIATARMYRGEHHPTDILASVLFAALWLTATTRLIQPNKNAFERGRFPGLPRHRDADKRRETAQSIG
jgi:membrane-associated phospholipid phosphatase